MREPWTAGWRVRVSDVIGGPVTFGSTILLPPQYIDWDLQKRSAVLAHEGAHVANRDFHVLLLASLNRAVFWFSPFAWWQLTRLAELAEIISDARALEVLEDRLSYAEILLDLAAQARPTPAGLAMARACTVRARVERILAATADPCEARLAQANLDGRRHPAGCRGFRRQHCLQHEACADAGDRRRGRRGDGRAQAGAGRLLFIGPDLDLRHLAGRQRALRTTQRATESPAGCGGRWHLFLPGGRRPDELGRQQRTAAVRTGAEPERSRIAGRQDRRIVGTRCRGRRCEPARTHMSARMHCRRSAC